MTTSLALLALSSFLTSNAGAEKPTWMADYAIARNLGKLTQKPLAVVVGSGQDGWETLSQEGKLGKDVNRLLAANYVCVYVDASDPQGGRLAAALEVSQSSGLVISNRTGGMQAFHHQGSLTDDSLVGYLKRYADPQRVVRHTETYPTQRVSYYPPSRSYAPAVNSGRNC